MDKKLGFKDFMSVDYAPGEPDQVKYNAKKRKVEAKSGYCSDDCCGADIRVEDCTCPSDCQHCDCNKSVEEALTMAQRRAKSRQMKKYSARLKVGRKKARMRVADSSVIARRARKQARNMIAKKLTKGISKADLTPARKQEVEKRLEKMTSRVTRLARKITPKLRQAELGKKRG